MRKYFDCSPASVSEADRNMSLLILSSNWVFNYPIPLMPSVVTIHSLHVKTTNEPLPNVSNRYSLSLLHNICRLHFPAQYVTDCGNSLSVKRVCKSRLVSSVPGGPIPRWVLAGRLENGPVYINELSVFREFDSLLFFSLIKSNRKLRS
jgi:hypothetical protein